MNWLFPERRGPSKYSILDHSLVTTPRADCEQVQTPSIGLDCLEYLVCLFVTKMVAGQAPDFLRQIGMCDRAPGGINAEAGLHESHSNTPADAAACARHQRNRRLSRAHLQSLNQVSNGGKSCIVA
jgi:hypothetical protein